MNSESVRIPKRFTKDVAVRRSDISSFYVSSGFEHLLHLCSGAAVLFRVIRRKWLAMANENLHEMTSWTSTTNPGVTSISPSLKRCASCMISLCKRRAVLRTRSLCGLSHLVRTDPCDLRCICAYEQIVAVGSGVASFQLPASVTLSYVSAAHKYFLVKITLRHDVGSAETLVYGKTLQRGQSNLDTATWIPKTDRCMLRDKRVQATPTREPCCDRSATWMLCADLDKTSTKPKRLMLGRQTNMKHAFQSFMTATVN